MFNNNKFRIGEEAMLYGQGSKGIVDFETNFLNKLIKSMIEEQSLKAKTFSNPSLSLGFEGGNINPNLKNWYGTLGTNVYPTSPEYRTDYEWEMGNKALMDWLITIGYRF